MVIEPHGVVTTQDFSLRWLKPCLSMDLTSVEVGVPLGYEKTVSLEFTNQGAADTHLWPSEGASWLNESDVKVPSDSITNLDITFTTFPTMTVGEVFTTTLEIWSVDGLTNWWAFYIPMTMTVTSPTIYIPLIWKEP